MICRRRFSRLSRCAGSVFLPFCSPSCFSFLLFREWPGAAKPPNLSALRQIITQYKVTQSITLLGQGFHPLDTGASVVTLHPTQRALPSGHPAGAAALHPAQRFRLWTLTRRSPLWTWRKGLATLCTPAKDADLRHLRIALTCIFAHAALPDSVPAPVLPAAFCSPWYAPCDTSPKNISLSDGHSFFKLQCRLTETS